MSWRTPKTDWVPTEYYSVADWTRVKENLEYCNQWFVDHQYPSVTLQDMTLYRGINELPTVELVNRLEANLEALYDIFDVPFTEWQPREYWYAKLSALYERNPNSTDWSRWEELPKRIKESQDYIDTYLYQRISGTFTCGSNIRIQLFSRGR